jgi:ribosomal protein L29
MKDEEITDRAQALAREAVHAACAAVTDKVEDTSQYGKIRKDIARLLTEKKRGERPRPAPRVDQAGGVPA